MHIFFSEDLYYVRYAMTNSYPSLNLIISFLIEKGNSWNFFTIQWWIHLPQSIFTTIWEWMRCPMRKKSLKITKKMHKVLVFIYQHLFVKQLLISFSLLNLSFFWGLDFLPKLWRMAIFTTTPTTSFGLFQLWQYSHSSWNSFITMFFIFGATQFLLQQELKVNHLNSWEVQNLTWLKVILIVIQKFKAGTHISRFIKNNFMFFKSDLLSMFSSPAIHGFLAN